MSTLFDETGGLTGELLELALEAVDLSNDALTLAERVARHHDALMRALETIESQEDPDR